jgi:hypothetical protein
VPNNEVIRSEHPAHKPLQCGSKFSHLSMEMENGGSDIQKNFVTYVGVVIQILQFYVIFTRQITCNCDKVQVRLFGTVRVQYREIRAQNYIHDYTAGILNLENVSNILFFRIRFQVISTLLYIMRNLPFHSM